MGMDLCLLRTTPEGQIRDVTDSEWEPGRFTGDEKFVAWWHTENNEVVYHPKDNDLWRPKWIGITMASLTSYAGMTEPEKERVLSALGMMLEDETLYFFISV